MVGLELYQSSDFLLNIILFFQSETSSLLLLLNKNSK